MCICTQSAHFCCQFNKQHLYLKVKWKKKKVLEVINKKPLHCTIPQYADTSMLNVSNWNNTTYSVSAGSTTSDGSKTYQALIIIHLESPNRPVHMYLPILNEWAIRSSQKIGISPSSKVTVQTLQQYSSLRCSQHTLFSFLLSLYKNEYAFIIIWKRQSTQTWIYLLNTAVIALQTFLFTSTFT